MFQPPFFGAAYLAARAAEVDLVILSGTDQFTSKSPCRDGGWQYTGMAHTMLKDGWWNLPLGASMLSCDETPVAVDSRWISKSMKRLRHLYSKSLDSNDLGEIEAFLSPDRNLFLGDFNSDLFVWGIRRLGITTPVIRDYMLADRGADKSDTALKLAVACGATDYVAGTMGAAYLDSDAWAAAGVEVSVQHWDAPLGVDGASSVINLIGDNRSGVFG
jgi:hypothetical protein